MTIFRKDSIWKGILYMGLGTVTAQLVNVLVQPILTRIVSPEVLGIYTYVVSLATIIIPVASLKLDMLVVTEENDNDAQYITDTCVLICVVVSIMYFIIIFLGNFISINNIFNKYGKVSYLVPVIVLTNGIRFLFISYNNRYKKYKLISTVAIMRESVRAIIQIGMGLLTGGIVGQVMGYAISPVFGLGIQAKEYIKKFQQRKRISGSQIKNIIFGKGKRQILYLVPAQFLNSFSASLITISITSLFSATVLGYYSTGVRVLEIPIVFITSNVSKVVYQRVNECVEKNTPILEMIKSVILTLSVVSIIGFGTLYLIAPRITKLFFGQGYETAGYYIRCLCLMYAARLVVTSMAGLYTVFGKQQYEFWLNIMLIVFATFSLIISKILVFDIIQYLWLVCVGYTITYGLMLLGYLLLCYKHDKSIKKITEE